MPSIHLILQLTLAKCSELCKGRILMMATSQCEVCYVLQDRKQQHVSPTWGAASWRSADALQLPKQSVPEWVSHGYGSQKSVIKVSVMLVPSAGSEQDLLQVSPLADSALLQSSAFLGQSMYHLTSVFIFIWDYPSVCTCICPHCPFLYKDTSHIGLGAHTPAVEPHLTYYTCNDPISK